METKNFNAQNNWKHREGQESKKKRPSRFKKQPNMKGKYSH